MAGRTPRSRPRWLVKLAAAVAVVAAAAYGVTLIPGPPYFDFSTPGRRHLHQIPIDRTQACSSVEAIHSELNAFEASYQLATFGFDARTWDEVIRAPRASPGAPASYPQVQSIPWPAVEASVDSAAQRLDVSLLHGMPHFPRRVRSELAIVRNRINEGRKRLPVVNDVAAFKSVTLRPFERGQLHAGYASDLVGRQCRVRLGADNIRAVAVPGSGFG